MPDTRRAKADILTLLADNTTGLISAQDVRDWLVSSWGGYASIYVADGATAQTGITTTPVKMTGFAANGTADGLTPDHTADSITIDITGIYFISFNNSFSGTSGATFEFHLRVNGNEQAEGGHVTLNATGDPMSCCFNGVKSLSAGDVLTVYVESDADAPTRSMTPIDAQLSVFQVS